MGRRRGGVAARALIANSARAEARRRPARHRRLCRCERVVGPFGLRQQVPVAAPEGQPLRFIQCSESDALRKGVGMWTWSHEPESPVATGVAARHRPLSDDSRDRSHDGVSRRSLSWSFVAPVAQLDRASVYGTEGQRFESFRARDEKPPFGGFSRSGAVLARGLARSGAGPTGLRPHRRQARAFVAPSRHRVHLGRPGTPPVPAALQSANTNRRCGAPTLHTRRRGQEIPGLRQQHLHRSRRRTDRGRIHAAQSRRATRRDGTLSSNQ